jgi:hypothetical protein
MKIPEIELTPTPRSDDAKRAVGFKWADKRMGHRHKLGCHPDWIQKDATPRCSCGKTMTFYGQLDSIGDEHAIADCGMIYVFLCFDCFEAKSVVQSG